MTLQEQFCKEEGWSVTPVYTPKGVFAWNVFKKGDKIREWEDYNEARIKWLESKVDIALGGLKGAGAGFMQIEMIGGRKDGNFFRDRMEMSEMSAVWYSNTRQTINQIKGSD